MSTSTTTPWSGVPGGQQDPGDTSVAISSSKTVTVLEMRAKKSPHHPSLSQPPTRKDPISRKRSQKRKRKKGLLRLRVLPLRHLRPVQVHQRMKMEKEEEEAERMLSLDERKRKYNSFKADNNKAPTEEDLEAYYMKRKRDNDPMAQFLTKKM